MIKLAADKDIYWVYILLCNNHHYYTGYTTHLANRYQAHVEGRAKCKYTRSFKPVKIAQSWQLAGDKSTALKIEVFIKRLTRGEKENIIQDPAQLVAAFPGVKFISN